MTQTLIPHDPNEIYWETVIDLIPIANVHKGDTFTWMGVECEVQRVASDGTWADIVCRQPESGATWRKRQHIEPPSTADTPQE